jgi:hypothetical protein
MNRWILVLVLFLLQCCATAPAKVVADPRADQLAALKAEVMSADYRGDLAELQRLRDELGSWPSEDKLAWLARYWRGFASWRMAINGGNQSMNREELGVHLQQAATDFYLSIRMKDDFADAYAAASMVNGWLTTFETDRVALLERASLSQALYARAATLEPDNPRVLWAKGSFLLFNPHGPDLAGAIAVYRQTYAEAARRGLRPSSPLPDWGKAEALMSIAYAHFSSTPPDLENARREALASLDAVPEWSYVRDILLPQIAERAGSN